VRGQVSRSPARGGPTLLWFRQDFRLADNPALADAIEHGAVIPVYIWAPDEERPWAPGGASKWWLHHSLTALDAHLRAAGSRLIVRGGSSLDTLRKLIRDTGATRVVWNRRYEPAVIARDTEVKEALRQDGIEAASFNAALLFEPWTIRNQSGGPFQVFTPFWKNCLAQPEPPAPTAAPKDLPGPATWPRGEPIESLSLLPAIRWDTTMAATWTPGEHGAHAALDRFCSEAFPDYSAERNRPDRAGTSRLSPHLHFGEVSPRQVLAALAARAGRAGFQNWRASQFVAEVGWREFAHHLLYHFPHTPARPLRAEWDSFEWPPTDPRALKSWQRGRTGFPIVDAGMRELWATGWMHNRVRMIVASFLIKDLMIPWTEGAAWFWDTLVDADLAANTLGWQWTAGCGADAAPYFRVFNPTTQGEKFDPDGLYVRRWVPELARMPAEFIHRPAEAPATVLAAAGIRLGETYPRPMVDHAAARDRALQAYESLRARRA
jgi:deoxyribodipyrimidine photo-lyase